MEGRYGIEVVGALPQGLPALTLPQAPWTTYLAMVLPAMGVVLVAYSEALGVAHEFAEKHGYEVDANQELNAHAAANLVSALFGGMLAGVLLIDVLQGMIIGVVASLVYVIYRSSRPAFPLSRRTGLLI